LAYSAFKAKVEKPIGLPFVAYTAMTITERRCRDDGNCLYGARTIYAYTGWHKK